MQTEIEKLTPGARTITVFFLSVFFIVKLFGDMVVWWIEGRARNLMNCNQSSAQAFGKVFICLHITAPLSKGWGGLEGHKGLLALQLLPCPSRSCIGGKEHGYLIHQYTGFTGCCDTWCNTPVPSSCHTLVAFIFILFFPQMLTIVHQIHHAVIITLIRIYPATSIPPSKVSQ